MPRPVPIVRSVPVNAPVVASGGAGKPEHLVTVFERAGADAAIIAGMAATSYAADQMQNELRESTQEQNRLLREQNEILSEMLAGGLVAEVSTMSIRAAQTRMNRRYGNFSGA